LAPAFVQGPSLPCPRYTLAGTELDHGLILGSFGVGSIVNALWVTRARAASAPK
jgi:hypothetical protein